MMKDYDVHFIELKTGEKIAYRQTGKENQKNLILIHGNMSSSIHWQVIMEQIENEYQIFALDMRGFGQSSYNKQGSSLKDFADDVIAFIDEKQLKKVSLVGWSTGGGVVLEAAAELGDQVENVILLSSVGITGYQMLKKDEKGMPIPNQPVTTLDEIMNDPVQVAPVLKAYKEKNRELIRMIWSSVIYGDNLPPKEDFDKYLEEIIKQRNLVDIDYSLIYFNMTDEDTKVNKGSGRADRITANVFIIHGRNDKVIPVEEAEKTKKYFGNRAQLIIFEDAGHSIVTDDTIGLAEKINQCIQKKES